MPHRKKRDNESWGDWLMRQEKHYQGTAIMVAFVGLVVMIIATFLLALSNFLVIHGIVSWG